MALEINEIGIRMRVGNSAGQLDGRNGQRQHDPCRDENCSEERDERIVRDCVRRVLEILAARQER